MATNNRVLQFDFFRGLMLVIMMFNHLMYFPLNSLKSTIYPFTYETFGFFTAAEGFIFLSGLVLGVVYTKKLKKQGKLAFDTALYKRALFVYKYHIGSFLFVTLLFYIPLYNTYWSDSWESQRMLRDAPFYTFLKAIFLLHQTNLLDILSLYVLYILMVPSMTNLLNNNRHKLFFFCIILLWSFGQFRPQLYLESISSFHFGWFEAFSWQSLFFIGYFIGYQYSMQKIIPFKFNKILFQLSLTIFLLGFFFKHFYSIPKAYDTLFSVRNLGLFRIVNFLALAYLIYLVSKRKSHWFKSSFFIQLGQNSIYVFVYHIGLCYALNPLQPKIAQFSTAYQMVFLFGLTLSLYIPVFILKKWQLIRIHL